MPTTKKAATKQPAKKAEPSDIEQMRARLAELEAAQVKTPEQKLIERLERENAELRGIAESGFRLETPTWPPMDEAEAPEILEVETVESDSETINELQKRVAKLEAAIAIFLEVHNAGR